MRKMLVLPAMLLVTACSHKAVYENVQINKRNECLRVPQAEYDRCMEGVDKPYEEYERERQDYLQERERIVNEQDDSAA